MDIAELFEQLDFPSKTKLKQAAKKKGISTEGIDALYKERPVGQLFGKAPASKGAIATAGEHQKYQADIIDYKQFSKKANDGFQHALSVTNVFDRKTHVLPLKSKQPSEVLQKFNEILTKFGATPKRLDVDSGNEFTGAFLDGMRAKNIEVHVRSTKPTADVNFLAVGDTAIGKIKAGVGRRMAAEKNTKWADKIEEDEHDASRGSTMET